MAPHEPDAPEQEPTPEENAMFEAIAKAALGAAQQLLLANHGCACIYCTFNVLTRASINALRGETIEDAIDCVEIMAKELLAVRRLGRTYLRAEEMGQSPSTSFN